MNAVIVSVAVLVLLSLLRLNVVISLLIAALIGGITAGLSIGDTVSLFSAGLGNSAEIALSYAMLGGFAVAISKTGLPNALVQFVLKMIKKESLSKKNTFSIALIISVILLISIFSQNLIPVHIAFIPILIPPLLKVFQQFQIDRRLIATVITFGLTAPYILLPVGFGGIYHNILATNMEESGLAIDQAMIPYALLIPVAGMVVGLLLAIFFTYRKRREYNTVNISADNKDNIYNKKSIIFSIIAVVAALTVQLMLNSMILGALAGIIVVYASGSIRWRETDPLLIEGMKMMSLIGFVMITASGFANVLKESGHVQLLVENTEKYLQGNQSLAAISMLVIGLVITMGIGSSFSTIPIITTIFVPLCLQLGFSPLATIAIIGTAAALGDAGSPASDSTLGPTSGLDADGQHNHIWDTCVPTFLHYNIPLIAFGWLAAIML